MDQNATLHKPPLAGQDIAPRPPSPAVHHPAANPAPNPQMATVGQTKQSSLAVVIILALITGLLLAVLAVYAYLKSK